NERHVCGIHGRDSYVRSGVMAWSSEESRRRPQAFDFITLATSRPSQGPQAERLAAAEESLRAGTDSASRLSLEKYRCILEAGPSVGPALLSAICARAPPLAPLVLRESAAVRFPLSLLTEIRPLPRVV